MRQDHVHQPEFYFNSIISLPSNQINTLSSEDALPGQRECEGSKVRSRTLNGAAPPWLIYHLQSPMYHAQMSVNAPLEQTPILQPKWTSEWGHHIKVQNEQSQTTTDLPSLNPATGQVKPVTFCPQLSSQLLRSKLLNFSKQIYKIHSGAPTGNL